MKLNAHHYLQLKFQTAGIAIIAIQTLNTDRSVLEASHNARLYFQLLAPYPIMQRMRN